MGPTCPDLPRLAPTCPDLPRLAPPCPALPRLAPPCPALPRLAPPCPYFAPACPGLPRRPLNGPHFFRGTNQVSWWNMGSCKWWEVWFIKKLMGSSSDPPKCELPPAAR